MTEMAVLIAAMMTQPALAQSGRNFFSPPAPEPLEGDIAGSGGGGLKERVGNNGADATAEGPRRNNNNNNDSTVSAAEANVLTPLYKSTLPTSPAIAMTISQNGNNDLFMEMRIDDNNHYTLYMGIGEMWNGDIADIITADILLTGHRVVDGKEQNTVEYLDMNMAEMLAAVIFNNPSLANIGTGTGTGFGQGSSGPHPVNIVMDAVDANMPGEENTSFWEAMSIVMTDWILRTNTGEVDAAETAPVAAMDEPAADDNMARNLAVLADKVSAAFKASRAHGSLRH